MSMECQECGGIMECIIRFVAMGSVHWCPRCGTLAAGSHPTKWKVPTLAAPGSENKARSRQTKLRPGRSARVKDRNNGLLVILEGPTLIDEGKYEIISYFEQPKCRRCRAPYRDCADGYDGMCPSCADKSEPTHWPCEYTTPAGNCTYDNEPGSMTCHQQNCPWTERQRDNDWWDGREGAMPGAYRPLPPMPDEGAF